MHTIAHRPTHGVLGVQSYLVFRDVHCVPAGPSPVEGDLVTMTDSPRTTAIAQGIAPRPGNTAA